MFDFLWSYRSKLISCLKFCFGFLVHKRPFLILWSFPNTSIIPPSSFLWYVLYISNSLCLMHFTDIFVETLSCNEIRGGKSHVLSICKMRIRSHRFLWSLSSVKHWAWQRWIAHSERCWALIISVGINAAEDAQQVEDATPWALTGLQHLCTCKWTCTHTMISPCGGQWRFPLQDGRIIYK